MGHNIRWDNADKTVVFQEYSDGACKDDLYQLAQKSAEMLNMVEHTIHLIIDERNVNLVLNQADMVYLGQVAPKNEGVVVVIVPPSKIKFKLAFQKLSNRILRKTYLNTYYVASLELARRLLQEQYKVRYP